MPVNFPGYRNDIPVVDGRPLLFVRCRQCGCTTVARSPSAQTVRGWQLPERWPYHARQLRATVEGVCRKCVSEARRPPKKHGL
jgi:ribosomal protein L40E